MKVCIKQKVSFSWLSPFLPYCLTLLVLLFLISPLEAFQIGSTFKFRLSPVKIHNRISYRQMEPKDANLNNNICTSTTSSTSNRLHDKDQSLHLSSTHLNLQLSSNTGKTISPFLDTSPCNSRLKASMIEKQQQIVLNMSKDGKKGKGFFSDFGFDDLLMGKKTEYQGRPTCILKLAVDKNDAVDDLDDFAGRFTSEESLNAVHRLRRECDAIVVGVGTVIRDDPSLTVRRVKPRKGGIQPLRVILDRSLRTPFTSKLLNDGHRTMIYFCNVPGAASRAGELFMEKLGLPILAQMVHNYDSNDPQSVAPTMDILGKIYNMGTAKEPNRTVLVEGGPTTARMFLENKEVDRCIVIKSPIAFQGRPVPSNIDEEVLEKAGLVKLGSYMVGTDEWWCWSKPDQPWPTENLSDWPGLEDKVEEA